MTSPQRGDFILTHGQGVFSALIRSGQSLRIHGDDRQFTYWNHAAMIVDAEHIVEALGSGVTRSRLDKYKPKEYFLVELGESAHPVDREQAVAFALQCVGQPYDWLTIVSIACSLITGTKLSFGYEGEYICSGLVARSLERTNAIFNRDPEHIMPADLAKYYGVDARTRAAAVATA
ncbi:MAG: hypothetical protein JO198_04560 [Candidatus Dormibacteraeota bacterium]|nr:hypothetical protein [Candidatus Dormibacteraeota bacterium]